MPSAWREEPARLALRGVALGAHHASDRLVIVGGNGDGGGIGGKTNVGWQRGHLVHILPSRRGLVVLAAVEEATWTRGTSTSFRGGMACGQAVVQRKHQWHPQARPTSACPSSNAPLAVDAKLPRTATRTAALFFPRAGERINCGAKVSPHSLGEMGRGVERLLPRVLSTANISPSHHLHVADDGLLFPFI
jgi:hypothetical protein